MDLLAFGAWLAMSVPRLSKEGGKTWREGESTRLSAWWWALRRLVAFRAMHGGTKRELGAIESQPHASLPGPDTCMPKRERHRCDLRGSSQWGATAPRWFATFREFRSQSRGERAARDTPTKAESVPACSFHTTLSIHPANVREVEQEAWERGPVVVNIRGWIEAIDMLAETFVQRPLPSPGQAASLGESRDMPDVNFQFWKHLLPLACGCNPARTPQRKAASPVGVLLLFVNIPCLPKDGRSRHGPLPPSGVLL